MGHLWPLRERANAIMVILSVTNLDQLSRSRFCNRQTLSSDGALPSSSASLPFARQLSAPAPLSPSHSGKVGLSERFSSPLCTVQSVGVECSGLSVSDDAPAGEHMGVSVLSFLFCCRSLVLAAANLLLG